MVRLAAATPRRKIPPMIQAMRTILILAALAFAAPAFAQNYPVSGQWGESNTSQKGAIDCAGKRVIGFNGDQRTDSNGGVPAYRNKSVTKVDDTYRVTDEFTTGQISQGRTSYTLKQVDNDHLEMKQQGGSTLTLQRCK
jgi:hypothetical protein